MQEEGTGMVRHVCYNVFILGSFYGDYTARTMVVMWYKTIPIGFTDSNYAKSDYSPISHFLIMLPVGMSPPHTAHTAHTPFSDLVVNKESCILVIWALQYR